MGMHPSRIESRKHGFTCNRCRCGRRRAGDGKGFDGAWVGSDRGRAVSGSARGWSGTDFVPNALHALNAIHVGDAIRGIGEPVAQAVVRDAGGETMSELPIASLASRYGPLLAVHRTELIRTLSEGLAASLNYGSSVTTADGQVFVDGQRLGTDLIVGADGIESTVRSVIANGITPRPSGQFAARGVDRTGAYTPKSRVKPGAGSYGLGWYRCATSAPTGSP